MTPEIAADYREALRDLIARKGRPVQISAREKALYPNDPDMWVSPYGWQHHDARDHCLQVSEKTLADYPGRYDQCTWVIPEGAELTEVTYSEFVDTYSGNRNEVGLNVDGAHCACGKYTNMTLRYAGSLGDVLKDLFGQRGIRL